ncbi:MAG: glutamate racemase [Oceanicoccus sp.]
MINAPHILVFDSGVGGLSIVKHIRLQLPDATITYLADNLYFPYGVLDDETLISRASEIVSWAYQRYQPSIIVLACNSASTLVLPHLRAMFGVPVVGVVPAIKPAAEMSTTNVIGLLATPATIQRDYTDELIAKFAPHCEVIRVGSSALVDFVERKMAGLKPPDDEIKHVLSLFEHHPQWPNVDTVVLACTHFPLIKQELSIAAPGISHWVDSGDAIARRIKSLIPSLPSDPQSPSGIDRVFFTSKNDITETFKKGFQQFGFNEITLLE